MLQRPKIKPHLRVERVEGAGVFVLSERRQLLLRGRLYELVVPRLDGRPVEEVCRELAEDAQPAQVFYTIRKLQERGFVCESNGTDADPHAPLWTTLELEAHEAADRVSGTRVRLESLGVDTGPLSGLLERSGVRVVEDGDLTLAVTDHYLHGDLAEINDRALESGTPWLLVKPVGTAVWIGPYFRPGETACWECLAQRMRANSPVLGFLQEVLDGRGLPSTDCVQTPATLSAAWGLVANTLATWLASEGEIPDLATGVRTIDLVTLESETHALLRQPACPACGEEPGEQPPETARVVLESRKKTYTADGGHRATSPHETIETYQHHVSHVCGSVSMLESTVPAGEGVMHVFVSGNNTARGPENVFHLKTDLRNYSCGKGTSEAQAKASALCEALERYSGNFRGDENCREATLAELGDAAIHPNDCMLFSDRQYERRDESNERSSVYNFVPQRFDPERVVEWTPVWSLTQDAPKYLPTEFCYFDYPHPPDAHFCVACSNGNAAGNTLEEAVLQGFLELVERDAVAQWWYNRFRVPAVDLDGFGEPYLDELREFFARRQRDLWVLDMTTDVGIPVFTAVSCRKEDPQQVMVGFGAHLDPRIALLRCVTELNQFLVPILDHTPEELPKALNDEETLDWVQTATLENQPYLVPLDEPPRKAGDYETTWTDDLREDVLACQSRVEALGLEMLVLNQTRPEIGMPVAKVIVPGMRHFWARFAPGRLYDVPVKLGRLAEPRTEEELNPIPMFL